MWEEIWSMGELWVLTLFGAVFRAESSHFRGRGWMIALTLPAPGPDPILIRPLLWRQEAALSLSLLSQPVSLCDPGPHRGGYGHRRRCPGHDLSLWPLVGSEKAGTPGLCDVLQRHLGSYMVRALGTGESEMTRPQRGVRWTPEGASVWGNQVAVSSMV